MSIKCLIVDDEKRAHNVLKNYINRLDNIECVASFYNAVDTYKYLANNTIDLILLDINMPEIGGFTLLDMLRNKPYIIFTTAYPDFAIKGFEYNAVDYLLKPIRFERFVQAIEKANLWSNTQQLSIQAPYLEIKHRGILHNIKTEDIIYIESQGNYAKIFCSNKEYLHLTTLNKLEDILPSKHFVRIHKSYLINVTHLESVLGDHILIGKNKLPIGKTYKKYALNVIRAYFASE